MEIDKDELESVLTNTDAMKEFKDKSSQSAASEDCCQVGAANLNSTQRELKCSKETSESCLTARRNEMNNAVNKEAKRKRSRTRKTKFRRRKPYHKLPRRIEDQESSKAGHLASRAQQYGKPYAPYNTTQFLMDDHNVREPDFEEIHKLLHYNHNSETRRRCHSESANTEINDGTSSDEFYSSPDDEHDFIQKQFSETYENIHAERLNSMPKAELVQEYLLLEERIEELERKLRDARAEQFDAESCRSNSNEVDDSQSDTLDDSTDRTIRLEEEIKRLREENLRLHSSNEKLQCILKTKDGWDEPVKSVEDEDGKGKENTQSGT